MLLRFFGFVFALSVALPTAFADDGAADEPFLIAGGPLLVRISAATGEVLGWESFTTEDGKPISIHDVTVGSDGTIYASRSTAEVAAFDPDTLEQVGDAFVNPIPPFGEHTPDPAGLTFGISGDLFVAYWSGDIYWYELAEGSHPEYFTFGHGYRDLVFDANGYLFVLLGSDIYRFDGVTGAGTGESFLRNRPGAVTYTSIAFGPHDGRLYAAEGNDDCVHVFDADSGEYIEQLPRIEGDISGIAFSPDGTLYVTQYIANASGPRASILRYEASGDFEVFAEVDESITSAMNSLAFYSPPELDSDGDGVADGVDAFPNDPTEQSDNDGDGIGDNADPDDDNDGIPDELELGLGTDPLLADTDGDGVPDGDDRLPLDAAPTTLEEYVLFIRDHWVEAIPDADWKNANMRRPFINKLTEVVELIRAAQSAEDSRAAAALYGKAWDKLEQDIKAKLDGAHGGHPKDDWITGWVSKVLVYEELDLLSEALFELAIDH